MSINKYIFTQWRREDQQYAILKYLWCFIAILVAMNILSFWGWKTSPAKLRVYLPPDISQGALLKANTVPDSTVYAFAYQIFTAVNTWSSNGESDYKHNINAYKNYLSPMFQERLHEDYTHKHATGALKRKRTMTAITGAAYSPNRIKVLGNGLWQVMLKLKITESIKGSVVKETILDYPLLISQVNTSVQVNPWGLVIIGFSAMPQRVETII